MEAGHQKDQAMISLEFSNPSPTLIPERGKRPEIELMISHAYVMKLQ